MLSAHQLSTVLLICIFSVTLAQPPRALSQVPSAPACLESADRKRVEKAKTAEKQLVVYAEAAERSSWVLWDCVSPMFQSPWKEGTVFALGRIRCPSIQDSLGAIECAAGGVTGQLAAWSPIGPKAYAALGKAQSALERAQAVLRYAEADARHSAWRLGPVVPNQIKAVGESLEDCEAAIEKLLQRGHATASAGG
jgi:hypothetical protein